MASSVPPTSSTAPIPAPARSQNRFAIASFVLALLPFVMAVLAILANATLPDLMNHDVVPGFPLFLVIVTGEYLGSHLAFLGALITGALGLSRAARYPTGYAWRVFALAGLALAILGLLALVCLDVVVAYVASACRSSTGC